MTEYERGYADAKEQAMAIAENVRSYAGQWCGECMTHEYGTGADEVLNRLRSMHGTESKP